MSKHTPGPWAVYVQDDGDRIHAVFSENQQGNGGIKAIAQEDSIAVPGLNHPDREANARLISAAPDLLAALVEMVAQDGEAIKDAKAFGNPFPPEMLATYNAARAAIAKATGDAP